MLSPRLFEDGGIPCSVSKVTVRFCADAFVAAGKEFTRSCISRARQDPVEMAFIQDLLNKFAAGIVAYHVYAPWAELLQCSIRVNS